MVAEMNRLLRYYRLLAMAVLVFAIPSAAFIWQDAGWLAGALVLGAHVYAGLFLLFALPMMVHRSGALGKRDLN